MSAHSCGSPIGDERFAAYWANELTPDEVAAIDDQLFACAGCSGDATRLSNIVQAFRTMVPPVITRADVERLRAQGRVVRDQDFSPGVRTPVTFDRDVDFLIHHLRGLELADAERVEVVVRSESGGGPLFEDHFAPFDRDRGEVLIACQRHFAAMPSDIVFDVRVHRTGSAPSTVATYLIPHDFLV